MSTDTDTLPTDDIQVNESPVRQMDLDAIERVRSALPFVNTLTCSEIKITPGLLPWYVKKAWRFGVHGNDRHIVVEIGGRSEDPGDPCYLSHISWRKGDEIVFHPFQISDWAVANAINCQIAEWFGPVLPPLPAPEDPDCIITKEPDRIKFACKSCGCEFTMPAHRCTRTTSTGCGGKSGGRTYVWLAQACPCCGTKCTEEYRRREQ